MKHGEDLFCRIPIGGCGGGVARRYEQRAEHRVGPKGTARSWKLSCWDIKLFVQQPLAVPPGEVPVLLSDVATLPHPPNARLRLVDVEVPEVVRLA